MKIVIAWWDLAESRQTIDSLRSFLRHEAVDRWSRYEGLLLKSWISDRASHRWGAVQVWETAEAAAQPLSGRAAELIGYPPTIRMAFDVEATAEGIHRMPELARLGLAFQG